MTESHWDLEEMLTQMDNYFKNVTKEQFLKDCEDAGVLHLLKEVPPEKIDEELVKIEEYEQ